MSTAIIILVSFFECSLVFKDEIVRQVLDEMNATFEQNHKDAYVNIKFLTGELVLLKTFIHFQCGLFDDKRPQYGTIDQLSPRQFGA